MTEKGNDWDMEAMTQIITTQTMVDSNSGDDSGGDS